MMYLFFSTADTLLRQIYHSCNIVICILLKARPQHQDKLSWFLIAQARFLVCYYVRYLL